MQCKNLNFNHVAWRSQSQNDDNDVQPFQYLMFCRQKNDRQNIGRMCALRKFSAKETIIKKRQVFSQPEVSNEFNNKKYDIREENY